MKANQPSKEAYQFIISYYEEKSINNETEFTLKSDISADNLENLRKILEAVGYFNTKNIVKDKASNLMNSALSKSKGFFNG